jgi:4-amino-4-deoxy-L-arabinose transferase-like glycosyltransferase
MSYEEYWRLSCRDRAKRQAQVKSFPPAWSEKGADPRLPLYEAQQPPLYYWLLAPIYWSVKSLDIPSRVWVLRCVTVLLASLAIPVAFATARRVFRDNSAALGAALVVASMPQLAINAFRVSNEGLSIALGSLAVLAIVSLWDSQPSVARGAMAGLAVVAALLTKTYFLVLLPWAAFVLVAILLRDRKQRKASGWQLTALAATCLVLSGWYYLRVWILTGTLTGEQKDIGAQASHITWAGAIGSMPWLRIFDFMSVSHIWIGNWSFLGVRSWMYRAVELIFVLGFVGVVLQTARARNSLPKAKCVYVLAMPWVLLLVGLCFQSVQGFRSDRSIGTMGYYLLCFVVPETILLLIGLFRLLPDRWGLLVLPVLAIVFNALDQFGTTFVLLPYYAGAIRHDERGFLPALRISQLAHGGASSMFRNLLANKPSFLTPPKLMIMMALSFGAAVALVSIACVVAYTRATCSSVGSAQQNQGSSRCGIG